MTKFQSPKGMPDFYAKEKAVQNAIFDIMRSVARRFAFQDVEPPVVESFGLLSAKSGEEIKSQIFMLEKKGSEELALRPEFTPGFARMFVERQIELSKPVKWFCIGKVWRYEAPQKGRFREFFQLNAEIFGSSKIEADAEIINLAISVLKNLGLKEHDFVVKINNRKLLGGILSNIVGAGRIDNAMHLIDKSAKINRVEFESDAVKAGFDRKQTIELQKVCELKGQPQKVLYDIKKMNLLPEASAGLLELETLVKFLPKKGIIIDLSIARGLAYYTGTVFEIYDAEQKFRALCGGGRYDELIEVFGGQKTSAVGFGMGDKTLQLFLEDKRLLPKVPEGPDFFVANINAATFENALDVAMQLRAKFSAEIDLMRRKLGKQLDYANSIRARKVVFVGEDEVKSGIFKVKDMLSGREEKIALKDLCQQV